MVLETATKHATRMLATVCFLSTAALAAPLRIFILAGQSNMEGYGRVSQIQELYEDPTTTAQYERYRPEGQYAVRDDVYVAYNDNESRRGKLTAGYGSRGSRIGPELGFGFEVGDYFDEDVLLIKAAIGGTALATDWRPPSAGESPFPYQICPDDISCRTMEPNEYGLTYQWMLDVVADAISDLGSIIDDYDANEGYELSGFVWFQGFNDVIDPNKLDEYEFNLSNLIRDVRQDLEAPDLPFIIGELGMEGTGTTLENHIRMRGIQSDVALAPEFVEFCTFVGTATYADVEAQTGDDGRFHYLGRADVLVPIGEAFGEAVVDMIASFPTVSPRPSSAPSLSMEPTPIPPSSSPSATPSAKPTSETNSAPFAISPTLYQQDPTGPPPVSPTPGPTEALDASSAPFPTSPIPPSSPPSSPTEQPTTPSTNAPIAASSSPEPSESPTRMALDTSAAPFPSPPTSAPLPVAICFSGEMTVQVKNQGFISMRDLKLGDEILVDANIFEPVYSFGHYSQSNTAEFLQIETTHSSKMLEISSNHMVALPNSRFAPASMVRVGDLLALPSDQATQVLSIKSIVRHTGMFAPFTPSGTLLVNGIKVSSYVSFQASDVLLLGGTYRTPLTYQWLAHTFNVLPRAVYYYAGSATVERYTLEGISWTVYRPLQLTQWWLQQNALVMWLVFLVVVLPMFILLALLDMCWQHPIHAAAVIFMLACRWKRRTKCAKQHLRTGGTW